MTTRIPTPPLPEESEIETKIIEKEVIKEVPVTTTTPPDEILQILSEMRDNMFALSHQLQLNGGGNGGTKHHTKSLPDIPDFGEGGGSGSETTDSFFKTETGPSKTSD